MRQHAKGIVRSATWRRTAWLMSCAMALSGCSLREIVDQSARIESAGTLQGTVKAKDLPQRDVVVALLRKDATAQLLLYRTATPAADGSFSLRVPAGDFYLGAFIDQNHDGHFQPGEPGQFYGKPSLVTVREKETATVALTLTPASKPAGIDVATDGPRLPEIGSNVGEVTTLDDARFDPHNGLLGMWRPFDFMAGPQGGLFMLAEFDPGRIPVLFVHGIGGTPRDFARTLEGLDQRRYQPWLLYYPSGVSLEMVSNGLASAMHQMQRRYGFRQYAVVAHSMGGLVSRSYVQKAWDRYPEELKALRVFVTVNSPLGGMDSAALAVERSPVVVASWQDVATGSDFLARLAQMSWPDDVPYYLVFSYDGDKNGDGTVPLASQLPAVLQAQARRIFGFQGTHLGTLSDPAFITLLNRLLDASMANPAGRKAGW
jgi:pimeloyl-ACP methyl ester carboxylesterase